MRGHPPQEVLTRSQTTRVAYPCAFAFCKGGTFFSSPTHDQLNRLTAKTYPDTTTVNYTYDNDSRLTQVTDAAGANIYHGAADNATGCGILLELARVWAGTKPAPPRSILFAAVTGEEQGLLGSEYL